MTEKHDWSTEGVGAFDELIEELRFEAGEHDAEVQRVVDELIANPMPLEEQESLLRAVFRALQNSPAAKTDPVAAAELSKSLDTLVRDTLKARRLLAAAPVMSDERRPVPWVPEPEFPRPVVPKARFHNMQVDLVEGYVDPRDLRLWPENDRLEIHVKEFKKRNRRPPTPDELLDIMLTRINLPGVTKGKDEFNIKSLARSIANNGVRVPPVIDFWGVPQDGNRRLASCLYILHSDEFDNEQKRRVSKILVRKMSEFAQPDEYRAVVVGLNFEPDEKMEWPDYIRARKVAEDWENMLLAEGHEPAPARRRELKRQLAGSFALEVSRVDRFLKMIDWADQFEEYHRTERGRGQHEVERAAAEHFQYFAEMMIGKQEGGVDHTLRQDEDLRSMTFDLLFDGKIKAWTLVRDLPKVARSPEARELMLEAVGMPNDEGTLKYARDKVDDAVSVARTADKELRSLGADPKIRQFVKFLKEVPVSTFEEKVEVRTLEALVDAFDTVIPLVRRALDKRTTT